VPLGQRTARRRERIGWCVKDHVLHWDGRAAVRTASTRRARARFGDRPAQGGSERGEPRLRVILGATEADIGGRLLEDRALIIGQVAGGLTDAQDHDAVTAEPGACRRVLLDHDPVPVDVASVETFDCGDQPKRTYGDDRTSGQAPRELWRNRFPVLGARRLP
jgi:hypothetical protein